MGDRRQLVNLFALQNAELLGHARDLRQLEEEEERQERRQRRWWTREWLLRRPIHGQYDAPLQELRIENPEAFTHFLRMYMACFHYLLTRVEDHLNPTPSNWRQPVSPGLKLALTLRFLATGECYRSMMYSFRVAYNTISKLVKEVCEAIVQEYKVMVIPSSPEEWKEIAKVFSSRWNFHHTLGAIDVNIFL